MLVAAMNPCPCGYYGSTKKKCTCSAAQVKNYLGRISGPLLDRFDLHVDVDPVEYDDLTSKEKMESSAAIRERVERARDRQKKRFAGMNVYCNAMIPDHLLPEFCVLDDAAQQLLRRIHERYAISARTHSRLQRVALSAADLAGHDTVTREDFDSKYLR